MELKFKKEPIFAELWDACLYGLLYNSKDYVNEILELFEKENINKKSNIIDTSSGTGFPSLELMERGYKIDCMDASDDEIEVFTRKAKEKKINVKCKKIFWKEIPENYEKENYDFAFCRGNSFIFAAGGWNKSQKVNQKESLQKYKEALKIFYDLLKNGGVLYIDKFKDTEKPHKTKVGNVFVGNKKYELLFYNEVNKERKERYAAMLMKDEQGKEEGLPNITYLLTGKELELMLKEVGFKKIEKINLKNEGHFDIWLAHK